MPAGNCMRHGTWDGNMADLASMTGFSDATELTEFGSITVELKSVNGRFLELSSRLPEEIRSAEPPLRERIQAAVVRGKLDCRVSIARDATAGAGRLDPDALAQLTALAQRVQAALPQAPPLGVGEILRWPGVLESGAGDAEAWRAPLLRALERALEGLLLARRREGAALGAALLERCDGIEAVLARLREAVPRMIAEMERRLQERLGQALGGALGGAAITREEINERIRQELTLHGMRSDVAEEMDRLATHVAEVRRIVRAGGAAGRRLDFLMQELNREANTIGSKASAIDMTHAAVELKLLIEQMREQVQNLE
jgi:uncharacterized protein (TIGR00255 family)